MFISFISTLKVLTGESRDVLKMRTFSGFMSLKTIIILLRYISPSAT